MAEKGDALDNTIHVIEHWQIAEPDAGRQHLIASGYDVRVINPWSGDQLPVLTGDEAGVMVMGGSQMVSEVSADTHPYMRDELRFVEDAMAKDVPLVGVCLGSQMIARVMGAKVDYHPDRKLAIGYYNVEPTVAGRELGLSRELKVLNGNSQGWDLPRGAELLATSDIPHPNQAFRHGNTLALQFHPEVTRKILTQWQTEHEDYMRQPGAQGFEEQNAGFDAYDNALKAWYRRVLDGWFKR